MRDVSGKQRLASMSSRAMSNASMPHVVVVSAGFCCLAAAYAPGKHRLCTTVLEVGVVQWAAHSIHEVAGTTDAWQLSCLLGRFFTTPRV